MIFVVFKVFCHNGYGNRFERISLLVSNNRYKSIWNLGCKSEVSLYQCFMYIDVIYKKKGYMVHVNSITTALHCWLFMLGLTYMQTK